MELQVIATALNLRAGPGTRHGVLRVLKRRDCLTALGVASDGWIRVRCGSDDADPVGFVSATLVAPVSDGLEGLGAGFPWCAIAEGELGERETPGAGDSPRILEYHASTTLGARDDAVAWCSSFVNFCVTRAGVAGTNSAWARSWATWGRKIGEPVPGCIVVFRRGTGGHVAFFVSRTASTIRVLGGNQSDQVNISNYPADRLIGYRVPV